MLGAGIDIKFIIIYPVSRLKRGMCVNKSQIPF
jgi:hypothetical protein